MEVISTQKYIIMSPTKIRPVVDMIKGMTPKEAVVILPHVKKRAATPLKKVILTAIANAKDQGVDETTLIFKEIQVGEGPRLKRGRPVSRGRWHPYKKRMSHIRVVLYVKDDEAKDAKKPAKKTMNLSKKKETKKGDK